MCLVPVGRKSVFSETRNSQDPVFERGWKHSYHYRSIISISSAIGGPESSSRSYRSWYKPARISRVSIFPSGLMPLGTSSFHDCAVRHLLASAVIWGTSIPVEEMYPTLMRNERISICVTYGILFGVSAVGSLCARSCFDGKVGLNLNCENCRQHSFCKLKRNATRLICHGTFHK